MKKLTPYQTYETALASLDNGGRFYNLFTTANDGEVSQAELARAAGVFSNKQTMFLFLEMSLAKLNPDNRKRLYRQLSPDLKAVYPKLTPLKFLPSQARERAEVARSAIVTGVPTLVESKTEFTGFIMIPISTGKTTTFSMIPIIDQYHVYNLRDNLTDQDFLVAHHRGASKLPEKQMHFGGTVKELKQKDKEDTLFLEIQYYTDELS